MGPNAVVAEYEGLRFRDKAAAVRRDNSEMISNVDGPPAVAHGTVCDHRKRIEDGIDTFGGLISAPVWDWRAESQRGFFWRSDNFGTAAYGTLPA